MGRNAVVALVTLGLACAAVYSFKDTALWRRYVPGAKPVVPAPFGDRTRTVMDFLDATVGAGRAERVRLLDQALHTLRTGTVDDTVVAKLKQLALEPGDDVVLKCIEALALTASSTAISALTDLLEHPRDGMARAAANALLGLEVRGKTATVNLERVRTIAAGSPNRGAGECALILLNRGYSGAQERTAQLMDGFVAVADVKLAWDRYLEAKKQAPDGREPGFFDFRTWLEQQSAKPGPAGAR